MSFDVIFKIGSLAGLVAVVYQIHNNRKNRPRIAFTFEGSVVNYDKDDNKRAHYCFTGIFRNQSLKPNSIVRLYLTVWDKKKRQSTPRFGHGVDKVQDISNLKEKKILALPLYLKPKEARKLEIWFPIYLEGTQDRQLLEVTRKFSEESSILLPKHRWEFLIEDTAGNLFDYYKPRLINRKLIDLWWTLPNHSKHPLKYLRHSLKILFTFFGSFISKLIQLLGFYK